MLDIRWIRSNAEEVKTYLAYRNNDFDIEPLLSLDEEKRKLLSETEELKAKRNEGSRKVGMAKSKGEDAAELMEEMRVIGDRARDIDGRLAEIEEKMNEMLLSIPNRPHTSVPVGKDENDNPEVRRWGEPRAFDFEPKAPWDIGEAAGIMDFEKGAALAQSRFTVLKGMGARLERALLNFMLDLHTEKHGYLEVQPPFMVSSQKRCRGPDSFKVRRRPLQVRERRPWLDTDCGGTPSPIFSRERFWKRSSFVLLHGLNPVLPQGGRSLWTGCARNAQAASVRQGRDGQDQYAGEELRGAGNAHGQCRGSAPPARNSASNCLPLHRRHGIRFQQDVRHRSLAAIAEEISGDQLVQ